MIVLAAAEGCAPIDVGCVIGGVIGGWANGVVENFVTSLAEGTMSVLQVVNSFWLYMPSPDVESDWIASIQGNLAWYTYAFAVLGIFIAVGQMLISGDFKGGAPGIKMIVNLILVTGVYTTIVALMLKAGDAFAPWIIEKATGQEMDITAILSVAAIQMTGVGPAFLLVILAFLGSIANALFMLVRGAMISLLVVFLPILAASSASESGQQAWKKANGYLIAFLLFKPVAAVILAVGLLQVRNPADVLGLDDVGQAIYSVAVGIMTLIMVALALPALVKFIVPVAANGTSMAFSGGAAAAAGVAGGAAVVSLGAAAATGGASVAGGAVASGGAGAASSMGAMGGAMGASAAAPAAASGGGAASSGAAAGGKAAAAAEAPATGGGSAAGASTSGRSGGGAREAASAMSGVSAAGGSANRGVEEMAEEH